MLLEKLSKPNPRVMSDKRKAQEVMKLLKARDEKRYKRSDAFALQTIDAICHDD